MCFDFCYFCVTDWQYISNDFAKIQDQILCVYRKTLGYYLAEEIRAEQCMFIYKYFVVFSYTAMIFYCIFKKANQFGGMLELIK